jgi:hypothetical protein
LYVKGAGRRKNDHGEEEQIGEGGRRKEEGDEG